MTNYITDVMEEHQLLPENQMGNQKERSIELAIQMVTETIHTTWSCDTITTLLQLNIKGAFDRVNHIRLQNTLKEKGFPA